MNISYLIEVANNKLNNLLFEKNNAYSSGDLDKLTEIENEIATTTDTINKLSTLL